jgi:hypothetical protein
LVTKTFLKVSHTTAGYDPSFMAGYAKSLVFPASSTLPELVIAAFGGNRPELAYKAYVLAAAAAVPWLIALSCLVWRIPLAGVAVSVLLALLYIWADFPINYAGFGMLPYFLSIPMGLLATGMFARFLGRGGTINWLLVTGLMCSTFLVHFTSAMVVVPAAAMTYVTAVWRSRHAAAAGVAPEQPNAKVLTNPEALRRLSLLGHVAVWLIPVVVLAVNAFWWLPGIWLASTKGPSGFAFAHSSEGVFKRLVNIVLVEPPIESVLLAFGLPGLVLMTRENPIRGWALSGFCFAGLGWGYLAGAMQALDFLQPGRHTYAFYSALAVAAGAGLFELFRRLPAGLRGVDHLDRWIMAGLAVVGIRLLGPDLVHSLRTRLWLGEPFLSSRPSPRLLWVVDRVSRYLKPGERLLYEEGGNDLPGEVDPFQRGRFSGLLPKRTGIEVIGGPYLHAALTTNFTQFGEGKLCGKPNWDRDDFVRYARLYRPAAILCWSRHAKQFCRAHPELVEILEEDGALLLGRVIGFGGDVIRGAGQVQAQPGRLRVSNLAADLDGSIVLRYHFVPYLRTNPSVACEPEYLEDDPVPFIRLRPTPRTRDIEVTLDLPDRL